MSKDLRLDWMAKARSQIGGTNMILARSSVRQDSPGLPVIQILSNRRPAQTNRRIESLPKQPQLVPTCSRRPQSGPRNALKLLQPATDADIHWKLKNQQIILLPIKNYKMSTQIVLCIDCRKVAQFRVVWLFQCQCPHDLSPSLPRTYWLLHFDNWMRMKFILWMPLPPFWLFIYISIAVSNAATAAWTIIGPLLTIKPREVWS